jgi:hypothetical protein
MSKCNKWYLDNKTLVYTSDPHPINRRIMINKEAKKLIIELEIPFEEFRVPSFEDTIRNLSGGGSPGRVTSAPWKLIDKFLTENEV